MKFRLIEEKENKNTLDLDEALGLKEDKQPKTCIICNKEYKGYGNNAEPVAHGQCCDKCNREVVIPARLKGLKEGLNESKTEIVRVKYPNWPEGQYRDIKVSNYCIVKFPFACYVEYEGSRLPVKVLGYYENGRLYNDNLFTTIKDLYEDFSAVWRGETASTDAELRKRNYVQNGKVKINFHPTDIEGLQKYYRKATKQEVISHYRDRGFEILKDEELDESLQKDELSDFFDKAKRLGVTTVKELKDLLAQEESKGNTEKEKIDAYADSVELGNNTLSNESLKEDLNKESLEQEIRKAIREHFKTWDDEDYEDMIGEYLVVEVEDQEDGRTKVEVRAELSYATLDNIADELNKIVQKYDKDAYFDHEDAGIINAFIDKNAQGKAINEYGASKDEKLQSVRLRDYRNTWSAIDHMEVNGVDYYMFENDTYGDETYYVVTANINNGPFYETFDDIETCLRDEGVLEESLTEGVNKNTIKKEVKEWARDDYENGVVLDIDDTAEFEKVLLDDHPDLKNRKDMPDLIYELKDLYFDTVDECRENDYDLDEKLIQGKSDATLKKNIATEVKAGKNPKQAYAIAKSIQKKNESFEDEHLGEVIKDDEIVDYFDNSVHDEDIVEDDFDEEHIEELTKKAIEESKKHTKEVGTTITENKSIDTPTQEIINESVNSNEEVAIDYISPNAVDANFQAQEVDLNNI